jgi:MoxR-like ATPase
MQERCVTVAGKQHVLPQPFMVFATQNPFESEGTFPLPEAQLDRFLLHTLVSYPDAESESRILAEHAAGQLVGEQHGAQSAQHEQTSHAQIADLIACVRHVHVDEAVITGIRDLVRSTRPEDDLCPDQLKQVIWYGAGPRAGLSLISVSRALALLEGQDSVRWEHVRRLARPALRHRMCLTAQGARDEMSADTVIGNLLERCEENHKNLARGLKSS